MSTASQSEAKPTGASQIVEAQRGAFREEFNRHAFMFSHSLAGHPLFELPRLAELAAEILNEPNRGRRIHWHGEGVDISTKWNEIETNRKQREICDAIERMDESESWILLYSVQTSSDYKVLLDTILRELEDAVDMPLGDQITWSDAYIFLASPHSITPFHIDHESTFLFQIHGHRRADIWDPSDRSLLTDQAIEDYYLGDLSAATYDPSKQDLAQTFALTAGKGVHHPSCAPHAFECGDTYSVAMGVHFCLRDLDALGRVYQANGLLRRLGLRPQSPGRSRWRDAFKSCAIGMFSKRRPKTKFELLRSGVSRITAPARLIKKLRPGR